MPEVRPGREVNPKANLLQTKSLNSHETIENNEASDHDQIHYKA